MGPTRTARNRAVPRHENSTSTTLQYCMHSAAVKHMHRSLRPFFWKFRTFFKKREKTLNQIKLDHLNGFHLAGRLLYIMQMGILEALPRVFLTLSNTSISPIIH